MTLKNMKNGISVKDTLKYIGLVLCFVALETVFRVQPELQVRYVSITDEVPILFDLLYGVIFATIIASIPRTRKKLKRSVYVVLYAFLSIFLLSQYLYCRIFDRVYGLKTLQYAGEGGDYAAMVLSYFDRSFFLLLSLFFVIGIAGYFFLSDFPIRLSGVKRAGAVTFVGILCTVGILLVPVMFKEPPDNGGGNLSI